MKSDSCMAALTYPETGVLGQEPSRPEMGRETNFRLADNGAVENRLRKLRLARGWTQDEAAGRSQMSYGQYVKLERGERRLTDRYIQVFARVFDVDPHTIIDQLKIVSVIGTASSLEGVVMLDGARGAAPMPPGGDETTVAIEVVGDVLRGIATDGWFLYFDDVKQPIDPELVGELCVVGLDDGRIFIRTPREGGRIGRYHLESLTAPPIYDAIVAWASLILSIIPKRAAARLMSGEIETTRRRGFRREKK